jgi:hypothetical protein
MEIVKGTSQEMHSEAPPEAYAPGEQGSGFTVKKSNKKCMNLLCKQRSLQYSKHLTCILGTKEPLWAESSAVLIN